MLSRVYVEKKAGYDVEAKHVLKTLIENLQLPHLKKVRLINGYDIEMASSDALEQIKHEVLSEPNVDHVYDETFDLDVADHVFAISFLPGQFDQRADSAAACIQMLTQKERPTVRSFKVYMLTGDLSEVDLQGIKAYLINPVDSHEISLESPKHLTDTVAKPQAVKVIEGFDAFDQAAMEAFKHSMGFAMTLEDLMFIQAYFITENRNPSVTELKAIDTYWSDHCRHTTFLTEITQTQFAQGQQMSPIEKAYERYLKVRNDVYGETDRPITLMDMAVINMKDCKRTGDLKDLDQSEEINACSIEIPVMTSQGQEEWLLMFKNETHNHPTEIEPFGGAATCLGGAIRDPLSGRSYVYQAMRVTGAANPKASLKDTLPGKLPQRKISKEAARGYASYGNQIGLATGQVSEVFHPNFVAKRMEVGAVIAACPKDFVVRQEPVPGDVVILLGGQTGRDGCGGATGSSKAHTEASIVTSGAEVQKGNAPTERKIQRLFRDKSVTRLIKRCNDFGAGGVSVAIGEIAASLDIDLDRVPKKYEGLDGTELAISESQERMAVVVAPSDVEAFLAASEAENLEATVVAKVTDSGRLRMFWQDQTIVDIKRSFLDSNGVTQSQEVLVEAYDPQASYFKTRLKGSETLKVYLEGSLGSLSGCSQKGLQEMFDSTIGAGTVLMPLGGIHQLTPVDGMVAKIPVLGKETSTCSSMTYGYQPDLSMWSPFHGAYYAVVESLAKQVALGFDVKKTRLSFQEYFERLGKDPKKWGKPFAALLGAFSVQDAFRIPAIGGKDSMSGSFEDIDVPPTLISFAVNHGEVTQVISPELKRSDSLLYAYTPLQTNHDLLDLEGLKKDYEALVHMMRSGHILSAKAIGHHGICHDLVLMAAGNLVGFDLTHHDINFLTSPFLGGLILEVVPGCDLTLRLTPIGKTNKVESVTWQKENISLKALISRYTSGLLDVFPIHQSVEGQVETLSYHKKQDFKASFLHHKPKVFVPVFPGTNCEYDMARAFDLAGGDSTIQVFNNLSANHILASIDQMVEAINQSQIIAIPGGFSAGDEPDGSAKFIATVFRNPRVTEAVMKLLKERDGLILGICNGFQALVKLGLIAHGDIRTLGPGDPTLTYNHIGRHISTVQNIRVASDKSPWMQGLTVGDCYQVPLSHGEGRFVAQGDMLEQLISQGQIATQYVDLKGQATLDGAYNPNGSVYAIEGAFSPDGRVFGKMGHTERISQGLYQNLQGRFDMPIFKAGIDYYK